MSMSLNEGIVATILVLAAIGICLFSDHPNKPSLSYPNCFIDKDTNETTIIVPEE
jgi:hypothetical protein